MRFDCPPDAQRCKRAVSGSMRKAKRVGSMKGEIGEEGTRAFRVSEKGGVSAREEDFGAGCGDSHGCPKKNQNKGGVEKKRKEIKLPGKEKGKCIYLQGNVFCLGKRAEKWEF